MAEKEPIIHPRAAVEKQLLAHGRRCRGPMKEGAREQINQLLAEGELEMARELDIASRAPCGFDVNSQIFAGPFDGQEHEFNCPNCGTKISYRAPIAKEDQVT